MNKKGLSPVIATVLLISIALLLATIIFIWAKSFVSEKAQKSGEAVELSCDDIQFDAEATIQGSNLHVNVVNKANIPLYGIEVRKEGLGSVKKVGLLTGGSGTVNVGETKAVDVGLDPGELNTGDKIIIVPIILGEVGEYKKAYTCDESYAVNSVVV